MSVKSVSCFLIIMLSLVKVHSQGCGNQTTGENCEPLCKGGCLHGVCIAQNTCRCDSGYHLVDDTCQPICTEPCEHGTCTAPDTCECNRGYYKRITWHPHTTSCKPHCPVRCLLNGYCDAPGRCKCNQGWRLSEGSKCVPVCRYPCGNGICLLPDRCLCAPGFQIKYYVREGHVNGEICEPISNYYGSEVIGIPIQNTSEEFHQSSNNNELSTTTTRDLLKMKSTYGYYKNHDENLSTTTTRDPLKMKSTYGYYKNHDENSSTTTTRDPLKMKSTYGYYNNHDENLSTTTTRDPLKMKSTYDYYENSSTTTTVKYSVSNSSSTGIVVDNVFNVTSAEKPWIQRNGMFIWIPLIVVVTAVLILILVKRRIPKIIINFFNRKSYNVQGAFLKRSDSGGNESLHIIRVEKETQCL